jgi:hypothetical protein
MTIWFHVMQSHLPMSHGTEDSNPNSESIRVIAIAFHVHCLVELGMYLAINRAQGIFSAIIGI